MTTNLKQEEKLNFTNTNTLTDIVEISRTN